MALHGLVLLVTPDDRAAAHDEAERDSGDDSAEGEHPDGTGHERLVDAYNEAE